MGEQLANPDGWQKPPNAPDHPYWDAQYRQKTENYRVNAQGWSDRLYSLWLDRQEQLTPGDIAVELEVLKVRNRGAYKIPKSTDNITLYDLWAAATWNANIDLHMGVTPSDSPKIAVTTERKDRFAELLWEAHEEFERPQIQAGANGSVGQ